uniref:Reverse transcriptase Ty1/copia-type domain-containing protein n=1 Tax=Chromera velia CCMP2878 TaxID=1169474 RepID=A0A0G4GFQ5_9ALVE|eukprot:Cvel_21688.t1-p1 / transcript=Cvel_21688.t1 / gene=Cvel_21688 / organism=Chromera_velia_CCMP2878 / gene_product=hypothetical protein / transcript_product=hypothetical protein / location=Cvel_scaffold2055:27727-29577(+) / protein_length=589 / sequence_SO=supercontig / SO=protein_coding / is_pseudo=false
MEVLREERARRVPEVTGRNWNDDFWEERGIPSFAGAMAWEREEGNPRRAGMPRSPTRSRWCGLPHLSYLSSRNPRSGFLFTGAAVYEEEMSRFKKGSTQLPTIKEKIESGSHKLAALKEWLVNIVGNRTLGRRVKRNEVRAVVNMGWRCTWKETDDRGRKPKARFFAKGFLHSRLVDTYVGTPSVAGINTVCLFIVFTRMEMGAADMTAAFLTSKDHNAERVGATLSSVLPRVPEENPFKDVPDDKYKELRRMAAKYEPGSMYLVEMGLYGLLCAAQLFDHKLEGVCKELGFKRVDTAIAEHKALQETFNQRLGFGSVCVIGEGSERKFSGVDISRVSTEEIHLSQVSYLENTDTAPLWEILKERRPSKPWKGLDGKSAEPSTEEEVDNQYEKPIRAGVGTLQWGVRMNPLCAVWGHTVVQSISKPSRRVFKTVVRIIKMLKGHLDKRVFTSTGLVPVVYAYFNAAFKFVTYVVRLGYVVRILHSIELRGDLRSLLENWITWATKRVGRKVGSSTAGEVLAFEFLFKKLFGIVALVKAMWGLKKVRVIVYTDSGPLHDQFRSGKAQTDATMQGVLEWCIQEMRVPRADL